MSDNVRLLRTAAREVNEPLVACLEHLLARAKAGEIVAFAYFVEDPSDIDTGYHGRLWDCLAGIQRLTHKINLAIDRG